jgi:hypothetical protein
LGVVTEKERMAMWVCYETAVLWLSWEYGGGAVLWDRMLG